MSYDDPEYNPFEDLYSSPSKHPRALLSDVQIVPSPNSAGLHPLKSALFAATDDSLSDNTHITRPNLSRVVGERPSQKPHVVAVGESSSSSVANEEKDVIIHRVSQKDSLAGVALKYGITLANLRRANQLWTSDSIHRRSVLYIPVESASRAREYIPGAKHAPSEEHDDFPSPSSFDAHKTDDLGPSINVVRVPANQLTYFPPSSSTKTPESRSTRHSLDSPTPPASSTRISPSPSSTKYAPSPLTNNSLTSILTALPIAASTRDEIITRLSFDSVSSSYSDRAPTDAGHELDEVRGTLILPLLLPNDRDPDDMSSIPTPKARPPIPSTRHASEPLRVPGHATTIPQAKPPHTHTHHPASCSPPQFYVSQHPHETYVRTSQPEPCPAMEIPLRRSASNTLGSASGKKMQAVAFGTERQVGVSVRKAARLGVRDVDFLYFGSSRET